MAFEYSESVYGVRTYGSSVGEVINASATVTATSSIANVNWVVAIGAAASMTSTSATTCSGEVVILEETDVFSYGSGLYGQNEYTQGDLQTVVTATSAVTASCERILLSGALSAGASGFAAIGGFLGNASATVTVTSGATADGQVVGERSATVTSASSITANSTCTFNFTIPIAVASATTCTAEEFFLEASDKMVYGHGIYGEQVYDQSDLQTVVTATSSATATCNRVQNILQTTVSVVANVTCVARRVPEGSALIDGTSTTVVTTTGNGARVRTSGATATPEATIATAGQVVGERSATVTATSTTSAYAVTVVVGEASLTATVTSAAICNRVRFGSGTPTAVASITVLGFATRGGIASCTPSASLVADSEKIWQGSTVTQPEATVTASCERIQRSGAAISVTSGTATIGREKWEIITNDSVTWTQIAA